MTELTLKMLQQAVAGNGAALREQCRHSHAILVFGEPKRGLELIGAG